jgi:hypothetical protein
MRVLLVLAFFVILVLAASPCWSGIPHMINYEGMLTDDSDIPLDGTYNLSFKIYGSESGDDSLWWEHHTGVLVSNGLFSVMLGKITSLPYSVFNDTIRYLGISVNNGTELSPRTRLVSVPYAYRSLWSDSAAYTAVGAENDSDWTVDGSNMYAAVSGSVGIGTNDPASKLNVVGGAFWVTTSDIGGSGCRIDGNTIAGTGVNPPGSNPLHLKPGDISSNILLAEDGGNVGIGIDDPQNKLHIHADGSQISYAQFTNGATPIQPTDGFFVGINTSGNAFISNNEFRSLTIQTNSADRMHITAAGKVGIVTTTPNKILHIGGGGQTPAQTAEGLYVNPDAASVAVSAEDNTGVEGGIMAHNNGNVYMGAWSNHSVMFRTNNQDRGIISSTGNFGIGITNPQRALHISDVLRLQPRDSAPSSPSEGDIYVNSSDHHIYCYLNGQWRQLDPQ